MPKHIEVIFDKREDLLDIANVVVFDVPFFNCVILFSLEDLISNLKILIKGFRIFKQNGVGLERLSNKELGVVHHDT